MENKLVIELTPHRQFNTITCIMRLSIETRGHPYHAKIELNVPELQDKTDVLKSLASEMQHFLLAKREQFRTVTWKT